MVVDSLIGGVTRRPPVEPPPEPEKRKPPIRPPERNPQPKPIKDPPIPPAPGKDPHEDPTPIGDPPDKSDQPIRMNQGYGVLTPAGWRHSGGREHSQVLY